MKHLLIVLALAGMLVWGANGASANHKNPSCLVPEEILDDLSASIPAELKLTKFGRADAVRYIELLFDKTGGGSAPFDLSKVKGGIIIYSKQYPKVYAGVIDGPNGTVCHAAAIPAPLNHEIVTQINREKS